MYETSTHLKFETWCRLENRSLIPGLFKADPVLHRKNKQITRTSRQPFKAKSFCFTTRYMPCHRSGAHLQASPYRSSDSIPGHSRQTYSVHRNTGPGLSPSTCIFCRQSSFHKCLISTHPQPKLHGPVKIVTALQIPFTYHHQSATQFA